jgi:hypothetical protein
MQRTGLGLATGIALWIACSQPMKPEVWSARLMNPKAELRLMLQTRADSVHLSLRALPTQQVDSIKVTEIHGTVRVTQADSSILTIPLMSLDKGDSVLRPVDFGASQASAGEGRLCEYRFPGREDDRLSRHALQSVYSDFKVFLRINGQTYVSYCKANMVRGAWPEPMGAK